MTERYGTIEETRMAQSRKSLAVKVGGKWYRTKLWELENMQGEQITLTDWSTSSFEGKTVYWINEYMVGVNPDMAAPPQAAPTQSSGQQLTDNAELLAFIGQCFAGYPFNTTDAVAVRTRAQMLYRLGKDILSGAIEHEETGPRHRLGRAENEPISKPLIREPKASEEEFEDDIPF